MTTRQLGENQKYILKSLKDGYGYWYAGCGWVWDNPSTTERLLDSLVNRGLLTSEPNGSYGKRYTLVDDWETHARELGYQP